VVATLDRRDCGILTLLIHTPYAAEIVVMGVRPELHRAGIGQALLERAEARLAERDIPYLQLKTLSRRSADKGYAATRAFSFGAASGRWRRCPNSGGQISRPCR
jgi:GNAT superfamily N-acetyltransferase